MTSEHLEKLASARQLQPQTYDRKAFDGLVRMGRAMLADARVEHLHFESRFLLAYDAAHALSLAALRHAGYRSEDRYLTFQCLPYIVGLDAQHAQVLSFAHDRGRAAEHGEDLEVDETMLAEVLEVSELVAEKLLELKKSTRR